MKGKALIFEKLFNIEQNGNLRVFSKDNLAQNLHF